MLHSCPPLPKPPARLEAMDQSEEEGSWSTSELFVGGVINQTSEETVAELWCCDRGGSAARRGQHGDVWPNADFFLHHLL